MLDARPAFIGVLVVVAALAGCGGDDQAGPPEQREAPAAATSTDAATEPAPETADPAVLARRPVGEHGLRVPATRARIVVKESDYGRILFDANGQVVYVFENDDTNRTACTSAECVKAWPPVLTRQQPSAGAGAEERLLGTIRRREGLQVTYRGRPLYFYEHEGPGEIRCHNVDLHGGLWWVVTAGGEPAE